MSGLIRWLVLGLVLLVACSTTKVVDAPTQVLLQLSCTDSALLAKTTRLTLLVASLEQDDWTDAAPLTLQTSEFDWPLEVPIFPRHGSDEARPFQVVIQAFDGDDLLAETRAVARFSRGKHKLLSLDLYACPGHELGYVCGDGSCYGETCEVCTPQGDCDAVGVTEDLPDQPSADAGSDQDGGSSEDGGEDRPDGGGLDADIDAGADGGEDAGEIMDAAQDASHDAEAAVDSSAPDTGGDAGVDAAIEPCAPSNLTRCGSTCVDLTSSAVHCGRCERACRSNQCSAGGCAATSIYTHTPAAADAGTRLGSAAIDPPFVYFPDPTSETVQRVTTNGGNSTLVSYTPPENYSGYTISSGYLYGSSFPTSGGSSVARMQLGTDQVVTIPGSAQSLYIMGLTTNTDQVVITSTLSRTYVQAIPKTGGSFVTLASGPSIRGEVEADDTYVYYRDEAAISRSSVIAQDTASAVASFDTGEVCNDMILTADRLLFGSSQRVAIVAKSGGTVTNLAARSAVALLADASYAYYFHGLGSDKCTGGVEIYRVPFSGGESVKLATEAASCLEDNCCPFDVMQDGNALYWIRADGLAIRRVEK